jgi:hypothetical protein
MNNVSERTFINMIHSLVSDFRWTCAAQNTYHRHAKGTPLNVPDRLTLGFQRRSDTATNTIVSDWTATP